MHPRRLSASTAALAVLAAVTACSPSEDTEDAIATENSVVAGEDREPIAVTALCSSDPFDACFDVGALITAEEAKALFASGTHEVEGVVGHFSIHQRARTCVRRFGVDTTELGTCEPWAVVPEVSLHADTGPVATFSSEVHGSLRLRLRWGSMIDLSFTSSADPASGGDSQGVRGECSIQAYPSYCLWTDLAGMVSYRPAGSPNPRLLASRLSRDYFHQRATRTEHVSGSLEGGTGDRVRRQVETVLLARIGPADATAQR